MAIRDPEIELLRIEAYRRMGGERRIDIAADMFEDGVAIARASILDQHPDITPEELSQQIRRRVLPPEMAKQVEAHLKERSTHE